MNILFLTTKFPYPPDSGAKIRDFNLIKEVSKEHDISLISFIQDEGEKRNLEFLRPYCKSIEVVRERGRINLFAGIFISLFTRKPFTIAKFYSFKMKQKIKAILSSDEFDLIHCSHLHMAQYVENIRGVPKILDEHNIEFFLIKRYLKEQKNLIKKIFVFFLQYLKLAGYESSIAQKFDHCFVVSEIDKKSLESIAPRASLSVISNGVDVGRYNPQESDAQPNSLVFTAVMDWFPNEDAVLYFYDKIWPLIKKEIEDVSLCIVGRNPSSKIVNLSRGEGNITVTGYVEDVRPYIAKSSVYIVPLRIGGGSRLKILEAMAMGKAVVSTSIGCEGLKVSDNENILIADSPEEFSAKIAMLLRNKELRNKLGISARKLVEDNYSWDIIGARLKEVYIKTVNHTLERAG